VKRIHLLRFDGDPADLAPLLEAAGREGLRVGWLELAPDSAPPVPTGLEAAVSAGASRSVSVAPGRTVTLKRRSGRPVLRDLLREHFLGCALVVVRAADPGGDLAEVPVLEVAGDGYRVRPPGEGGRTVSAAALAARLRRPRPW
jgi:hypothetical protein